MNSNEVAVGFGWIGLVLPWLSVDEARVVGHPMVVCGHDDG